MRVRRKFQQTNASERKSFFHMWAGGMPLRAIAEATGFSLTTVHKWIHRCLRGNTSNSKQYQQRRLKSYTRSEVTAQALSLQLSRSWVNCVHSSQLSDTCKYPLTDTQENVNPFRMTLHNYLHLLQWHIKLYMQIISFLDNNLQRNIREIDTKFLYLLMKYFHYCVHYTALIHINIKSYIKKL